MITTIGIRKAGILLIWLAALAVPGNFRERLVVAIFDQGGTPAPTLRDAAGAARRIFDAAGIETEWVLCPEVPGEHCALPAEPYITVILLSVAITGTRVGETLGLALAAKDQPSNYCYVYRRPAKALAEDAAQPESVALACVIAHEIGHLRGLPHCASGIMKRNLERRDILAAGRDDLHFTLAESHTLQMAKRR